MSQLGLGVMISMLGGGNRNDPTKYYGKKIKSIKLNDSDRLEITFEDGTEIDIWDDGQSCCEHRYMRTDDSLDALVGAKLTGIEDVQCPDVAPDPSDDYAEPHEVHMLKLDTDKGGATFSFHNEHNGYYGGFSLCITRRGAAHSWSDDE